MQVALALVIALASAGLGWSENAHAQGIQVSPVVIDMPTGRGVTSFRLRNLRDRDVSFEIETYTWTQNNGESVLTPTTDVVVAPPVFLIGADGEQIVRVGVSSAARAGDIERSYRVLVRELPNADRPTGFRLQLEMSMPVFVRPAPARGELSVRRIQGDDGGPAVRIANTGRAHLNLSEMVDAAAVQNLPRYLLPGAEIVRPLVPGAQSLRLMVAQAGASAAEEQRFEFSDAPVLAARR